MLISNTYKAQDVVTFKLTSGEELIGRFIEEGDTYFELTKPINLVPTQSGGIGMAPPVFSAEVNRVKLQKSAVVLHSMTRKEVADEYIKATTSIKPASSLVGLTGGKSS